jgi:hypothetical protein
MLEPDKYYRLEYRTDATAPWSILGGIDVTRDNEGWDLDTRALAALGTAAELKLSCALSRVEVPNTLRESTPTVVPWNEAKTGLAYPTTGFTFAGPYTYAVSGAGTASGTLAVNIQIQPRAAGGATISTVIWYTPGASGTPTPVNLKASGDAVILSRLDTSVTPVYKDPCYSAISKLE